MTREADGRPDPLKTAGEIAALLAGGVAVLYLLGGAVFALRLMLDNFRLDAVVNLIGQLPREFVITAGFVEAVAPAFMVGLVATICFAAWGGPRKTGRDPLNAGDKWLLILFGLAGISLALLVPALVVARVDDQGEETIAAGVAWIPTFLLVLPSWWVIRQIGKKEDWLRFPKAVAGGLVWMGMSLVPAVAFAGGVEFEQARICVSGSSTAVTGFLIADTKDRVLLGSNKGDTESVLSFPSRVIQHVQYGDLGGSLDCSTMAP